MKYKGFNVIFVGADVLKDYEGMNYYASKSFGFPWRWSKKTVLARDYLKKDKKELNKLLIHEVNEYYDMEKGEKYWDSHLNSLEKEKEVK